MDAKGFVNTLMVIFMVAPEINDIKYVIVELMNSII